MRAFAWLADSSGLIARGAFLSWQPALLWLHGLSDGLIALAYCSVPVALAWLLRSRRDAQFRSTVWLFAIFMLACGTTHALSVVTLWIPAHRLEGLIKLITAALSVAVFLVLWPIVRQAVRVPSSPELARLKHELQSCAEDLKRTTARLRDHEISLQLANEFGQVDSWNWDAATGIARSSDRRRTLLGLGDGGTDLTRDDWLAAIHPDDRDDIATSFAAALRRGTDYVTEFRVVRPDGQTRWVSEAAKVVRNESGEAVRMLGVTIDVTERKRLNDWLANTNQQFLSKAAADSQALRQANEQYRAWFENSPDGMFIVRVNTGLPDRESDSSSEFVFEAFNAVTERRLGPQARALLGLGPHACFEEPVASELVRKYRQCAQGRQIVTYPSSNVIDGHDRHFETSLAPVCDSVTGQITCVIGASRDVTERKNLEEQVRSMQKTEVTGRLVAGVAHDFNNLLQGLMGGLEMLTLEVADRPAAGEYADIALHSARRGAELTHRLLAFSRQQTLRPDAIRLRQMLGSLEHRLARTLGTGIEVVVTPPEEDLVAYADGAQLEAALLNLAVNARDALPEGGRITIAWYRTEPDEAGLLSETGHVKITVTDTGVGMDEATLAQACEPFFTTKGAHSSGLGLSMVQGFARQSGGDVSIDSSPGAGTVVTLFLPLTVPEPVKATAPICTGPLSGRILLVDDEPDVLVTGAAFLRHSGFAVTQVENAAKALQLLRTGERFDALVTDYAMPGSNGLDLVHRARDIQPGLSALIITGFLDLTKLDLDDVTVLRKPFGRLALVEHVRSLIEGQSAQASAAPGPGLTVS
jgi:PAS domain S-box-containing protein